MGTAISILVSVFISLLHGGNASVSAQTQVKTDEILVSPTGTLTITPTIPMSITPTSTPAITPTPTVGSHNPSITPSPSQDKDDQGEETDENDDAVKVPFGSIISNLAHEKNELKEETHEDADTKVKDGE